MYIFIYICICTNYISKSFIAILLNIIVIQTMQHPYATDVEGFLHQVENCKSLISELQEKVRPTTLVHYLSLGVAPGEG